MKKFFAIFFAIILISNAASAANWQPERRIGILKGAKEVILEMSKPCVMTDTETKEVIRQIDANRKFILNTSNLKNKSVDLRGEKVELKDMNVTINGKKYFGGVRIIKNSNSITVINLVPVEEYLRGVVPKEMSPSFEMEALKAQAVAARTFLLKNDKRHESEGYDACTGTHCQVYEGVEVANAKIDQAIKETHGEVLYYKGTAILTTFHADSGGMTASGAEVWGTDTPYLQSVSEIQKQTQPWTKKIAKKIFAAQISEDFGELKKIELTKLVIGKDAVDRTNSGRVKFVNLVGNKTVKITGDRLRAKFSLPSTLFDMKIEGDEVIITGFGSGHGVGMSQHGANNFAKSAAKYDKILLHYYKGAELKKLY